MTQIYDDVLADYNFTNLPDNDASDNLVYPKQTDVNGYYTITYENPSTGSILLSTGYYTTTDEEYLYYRPLTTGQEDAIDIILHNSVSYDYTYSAFYSDVAKINFVDSAIDDADIVFYQNDVDSNIFQAALDFGYDPNNVSAFSQPYSNGEKKYGDIVFNEDLSVGWNDLDEGGVQFETIIHEIGHSLGLEHPSEGYAEGETSPYDNQKYTMMSYSPIAGMVGTTDVVVPSGLQLLDIAAIQEIYGVNWETRSGDTTYSKTTAFASSRSNDAFIYTIWDGAGEDTIDASGYADGVKIDLREGAFSSIGKAADSSYAGERGTGLADDNVAIAYKAEIENAIGTNADDELIGNDLDNILEGGAGNDILTGGVGDDIYVFNLGDGHDTIIEDVTDDTTLSSVQFGAGINAEALQYEAVGLDLVVTIDTNNSLTFKDYFSSNANIKDVFAFNDGASFNLITNNYQTIKGSNNGDLLIGNSQNNMIRAGDGNDTVYGGAGNDTLLGGAGADRLYGGAGNDDIHTRANIWSNESIIGGIASDDYVDAGDGDDTISVNAGNSTVYGGNGEDDVTTNGGGYYDLGSDDDEIELLSSANATIEMGSGNDRATVGKDVEGGSFSFVDVAGDDHYSLWGGNVSIEDTDGSDWYSILTKDFSSNLQIVDSLEILDSDGYDTIWLGYTLSIESGDITQSGDDLILTVLGSDIIIRDYYLNDNYRIETGYTYDRGAFSLSALLDGGIIGNKYGNYLYGDEDSDHISGAAGNDIIYGYEDDDTLEGDAGNDQLYGGDGLDTLLGGENDDTLIGGAGNDTLNGGDGVDTVDYSSAANRVVINLNTGVVSEDGDGGSDTLSSIENAIGSANNDILYGGWSYNILAGGLGNDDLRLYRVDSDNNGGEAFGGAGDDILYGTDGFDVLDGGDDNDVLNSYEGADILRGGGGLDILYATAAAHFDGGEGEYDEVLFHVHETINSVTVDLGAGTVENSAGDQGTIVNVERVRGTQQDDTITGDTNHNLLVGYGGNDIIDGHAGRNYIDGGDGDDTIYGGDGDDISLWDNGAKIINASLIGGSGNDIIYGEGGSDRITGDNGEDLLYGGSERDYIYGGNDNDTIYGDEGNDQLYGDGGSDILYGGSGIDNLYGLEGNDFLYGGANVDGLYGGAGSDVFVFENVTAFTGRDYIQDFSLVENDVIDISDLLSGYDESAGDVLTDFVQITDDGISSHLYVDTTGTGSFTSNTYIAKVVGVTGSLTDEQLLEANGNLII